MLASHLGSVTLAGLHGLGEDGQLYKGHVLTLNMSDNTWIIGDSYGQELGRGFPTLESAHRFIDQNWGSPEENAANDLAVEEMRIRTRALEVGDDPDKAVAAWKASLRQVSASTTDTGLVTQTASAISSGVSSLFSGIKNLFSAPATAVPTAPVVPAGNPQPVAPLSTASATRLPSAQPVQLPVQGPGTQMTFSPTGAPSFSKTVMPYVIMGAMGLAALYVVSTSGGTKKASTRRRKVTKSTKRRKTASKRRKSTKRSRR